MTPEQVERYRVSFEEDARVLGTFGAVHHLYALAPSDEHKSLLLTWFREIKGQAHPLDIRQKEV